MSVPQLQLLCMIKIKFSSNKLNRFLPPLLKNIFESITPVNFSNFKNEGKRLVLKLLEQKEYPSTCAGGFAVFSLKETKTFSDIDIFTFIVKGESLIDINKMIKRKIRDCNIKKASVIIKEIQYPVGKGFRFKISLKNGMILDFVCLYTESVEEKEKLANDAIFRAEHLCENFDLKICQVAFIQVWQSVFIVYRFSSDVPIHPNKITNCHPYSNIKCNKIEDCFTKKKQLECVDAIDEQTIFRLEKYCKRIKNKLNKNTPERLVLTQNFVIKCLS